MITKVMQGGAIIPQALLLIFMIMAGTIGAGEVTTVMDMVTVTITLGIGTDGTIGAGEVTTDTVMDMVDITTHITDTDITTDGVDTTTHIMDITETSIIIMGIEAMRTIEVGAATIIKIRMQAIQEQH